MHGQDSSSGGTSWERASASVSRLESLPEMGLLARSRSWLEVEVEVESESESDIGGKGDCDG